jgi:undecaprenyl-diphosphatase
MNNLYAHLSPFLPHLQAWIQTWIKTGGPAIVFLVTFIEGIPPLGLLAPSHTVVLFAAFLAKIGVLQFSAVAIAALSGMIIGDTIGYFMGKHFGYSFLNSVGRIFSIKKDLIEKLKGLIATHLGKTFFIGKFNPLTRALAPFMVGASEISFLKFFTIDVAANVMWTAAAMAVGYAFGASYGAAAAFFGRFIIIALVIVIFVAIVYRFVNKQFHIFARYELLSLIANLLALFGLAAMLQGVSGVDHFMAGPDVATNIWFGTFILSWPSLVTVANFMSNVFGPVILVAAAVGLPIYFFIKKRWRYLFVTIASLGGTYAITEFLKNAIASPRPPDAGLPLTDYSFPSAHAAAAGAILVLAIYFFAPRIQSRHFRQAYIWIVFVLSLLVVVSRLVLGVHWLSDVIAGYSLGILWTTGMILLVRYGELVWRSVRGWRNAEESAE